MTRWYLFHSPAIFMEVRRRVDMRASVFRCEKWVAFIPGFPKKKNHAVAFLTENVFWFCCLKLLTRSECQRQTKIQPFSLFQVYQLFWITHTTSTLSRQLHSSFFTLTCWHLYTVHSFCSQPNLWFTWLVLDYLYPLELPNYECTKCTSVYTHPSSSTYFWKGSWQTP